jgi:hypothetical protein
MKASYWEGVMVVASTAATLNNLRKERLKYAPSSGSKIHSSILREGATQSTPCLPLRDD